MSKSKFKSKIPWREKLNRITSHKITDIPPKMQIRLGKGKILIPNPADIEKLVRKIRKGKLVTKSELRRKLADDFEVDVACPITTGIFLRIISEASEEDFINGKKLITPYWRILDDEGCLNEKFPGGIKKQSHYLKKEGHKIIKSKNRKKSVVEDFESKLTALI